MLTLLEKASQTTMHMVVAFIVTYAFTGSWQAGGLLALVEPVCNVILLPFHNRFWRRLKLHQRNKQRQIRQSLMYTKKNTPPTHSWKSLAQC